MNRAISFIGMGKKANYITTGETGVEIDIKKKRSFLVIVAEDASANTIKKFKNMTDSRDIEFRIFGTKEELGQILGKQYISVLSLKDQNFANALLMKIEST
ncbi:MAG: ribosomal L7Ae/L30e/S12e/Gadd45 family protein [Andreesenia angusta]|nr:ribosomal L7Ae/L30e/S12e/Gadd45 family protein [Andreesenia angusta]